MTRPSLRICASLLAAAGISACISFTSPVGPAPVLERVMTLDGLSYPFVVYVPTTYDPRTPLPAMLLVHGGGGNGPNFIDTWSAFAESHGIILVAPTLDLSAAAEVKVPVVFPRLMDAAKAEWNIDPAQCYLFGYSAGGYFVYDAALLNADYFAGAGIFASVIQPDYDSIVTQAKRKTRIAIFIGDDDPYFTVEQGRRTRDLLVANGMNVHYVELPGQDHNYAAAADRVNAETWQFLTARP